MKVTVHRASRLNGTLEVPGDKSLSHRALLFGALAEGRSVIDHLGPGADVGSTATCLEALGVSLNRAGALQDGDHQGSERVVVEGRSHRALTSPAEEGGQAGTLDCGNSGTSMRLLSGVLAGAGVRARLVGDEGLSRRPMRRVLEPLRAMGARCQGRVVEQDDGKARELPPLVFEGRDDDARLRGRRHELPVASAQVKSCLLLAGLYADGPTSVSEPGKSRDHTERMLRAQGAELAESATGELTVQPLARPLAPLGEVRVPGDPSSAAFFLAAASLMPGAELRLPGTSVNPTRIGFLRALQRMGADVELSPAGEALGDPVADLLVRGAGGLKAIEIGPDEVPSLVDEVPLLAVVASQAEGTTVIKGAGELRVKESDRLATTAAGLQALGADVEETEDGLIIRGPVELGGGRIASAGDHRIAMSFAVAGLYASEPVVIDDAEWVDISFPGFFDHLAALTDGGVDVD